MWKRFLSLFKKQQPVPEDMQIHVLGEFVPGWFTVALKRGITEKHFCVPATDEIREKVRGKQCIKDWVLQHEPQC